MRNLRLLACAGMILSVTALGSRDGDAAGAVARVVDYLDGRTPCPPGRSAEWWDENEMKDKAPCPHGLGAAGEGALAYYADSVEGPGRWLGRGLAGFSPAGEVARAELEAMLFGRHPGTGEQLLDGSGSATRANHLGRRGEQVAASGPDDELLSLPQAASLLGMSPEYLRRIARATAVARAEIGEAAGAADPPALLGHPYLDAVRDGPKGHWQVSRAEVARYDAARRAPTAVIGYDLTFSVPKSVSLLWAHADAAGRGVIVEAVDAAVAAGVAYIEEHAAFIRSGPGSPLRKATGVLAASYLHGTSRALDPQLHAHVVVANMAEGPGGQIRALDGRRLFTHAKTAGYLAAAELRHQLARRLGVEWEPAERGLADVAGVPRAAIDALSKRSQQLDDVVADLEKFFTRGNGLRAKGRQVAAYLTRAAKEEHGVDPASLRPWWQSQLEAVGFGQSAAQRCLERQPAPALVTEEDRARLFELLGGNKGLTEMSATFTRRDILQRVAEWAGDRLGAAEIADLADAWLTSTVVVRLEPGQREARRGDVVRLRSGRALNGVGDEALYSTAAMVSVEEQLLATYARGRHAGAGVVGDKSVETVLASRPELGEDQAAMVTSICTSGHRIQCVLGPAGSGKTFALAAAARAWHDAGYVPIGATVQGTAVEVLRDATAMDCSTVADLLTRLDHNVAGALSDRHIVVVDESSTLGNRDLARLARYVELAGASLRLIGDPAQHSAVAAGGGWRALLERYPQDRAELVERRRQAAPEMTEVRLASIDYAAGEIERAIDRLRRDERIVEADTPDELLDALVADWYVDRLRRAADSTVPTSSMIADHHVERRELNLRARALLVSQGQLIGPAVEVGGQSFQVGDEVIDVQQERALFPRGGTSRDRVRTGERGVVIEVLAGAQAGVVVNFERRGRVEVRERFLAQRVRPGVVGVIAHSYAITSHMAQGETYYAGRHLTTDVSSREGVYVGLTRGKGDARLYMVRRNDLIPPLDAHLGLPRLADETETVAAVTARLDAQQAERLATEVDPAAAGIARLRASRSLAELAALAAGVGDVDPTLAERAYRQAVEAVAGGARLAPPPELVARLGPRPAGGLERATWDRAVGAVAVYRERFGAIAALSVDGAVWALGDPPRTQGALEAYMSVARALNEAERSMLHHRPLRDLATDHRQLGRTMAGAPSPGAHTDASTALLVAREQFDAASGQRDQLAARLKDLSGSKLRRKNPQGLELLRRDLARAEQRVANAELVVQRALATLGAVERRQPELDQQRQRLVLLAEILDAKVEAAVARPAPYLVAVIGPPDDPQASSHWRVQAVEIEKFRHHHLGRSPDDGVLADGAGLAVAIGARPPDHLAALAWDQVVQVVAAPEGRQPAPAGPQLGVS